MLIAVVLSIIGFVVVGVIVAASVYQFAGLGSWSGKQLPLRHLGSAACQRDCCRARNWMDSPSRFFLLLPEGVQRGRNKVERGMFQTAALIYFIGAILTIISFWTAVDTHRTDSADSRVLLDTGYSNAVGSEHASTPPGSPTMSTRNSYGGNKVLRKVRS